MINTNVLSGFQPDVVELANVTGTVNVTTGAGNDVISIQSGVDADITIDSGEGGNSVTVANLTGTGSVDITNGTDDDEVTIVNSTFSDLTVVTNAGENTFEAIDVQLTTSGSSVTTGNDADIISLINTSGLTTVNTNAGNDLVTLIGVNATTVNTGNNEDQITVNASDEVANNVTVNGNANDDTFILQSANSTDVIVLNGNDNNDTFNVTGQGLELGASITLTGGNNTDTFNFNPGTGTASPTPTPPSGTVQAILGGTSYGLVTYSGMEGAGSVASSDTTVQIDGAYAILEGQGVTLAGSTIPGSSATITAAQWILAGNAISVSIPSANADGSITLDTTVSAATLASLRLNDDGVYDLTLEVTDSNGDMVTANSKLTVSNVAPVATINPIAVNIDEGDQVDFTGLFSDVGTADIVSIEWDLGNGDIATDTLSASTTYENEGIYTVTFTATDDDGGSDTATLNVTVNNVAPIFISATLPNSIREGEAGIYSAVFTDPGVNDILTYTWNFGDGTGDFVGQDVSHTYTASGTYSVVLTVNDGTESVQAFESAIVTDAPPVITEVSIPESGNEGQSLSFSALATDISSTNLTYTWNFGDDTGTFTGSQLTHTFSDSGTYDIILTVIDEQSNVTIYPTTTIEIANLAPTITELTGPTSASEGDPLSFSGTATDPGGDAITYSWEINGIEAGTGQTLNQTFADQGVYTITLTAEDDEQASSSQTLILVVENEAPTISVQDSLVSVNEGQTATNSVTFGDVGSTDTLTLNPSIGSITNDGNGNWTWNYLTDGADVSQTVTLTVSDGEASSSVEFEMDVINLAPVLQAEDLLTIVVNEGDTATKSGTFSDISPDIVSLEADLGDLTIDTVNGTWSWTYLTTDGSDESATVTITATDNDGDNTSISFGLRVNNVAPTLVLNASSETVNEGIVAFNSGSVADPGDDDIFLEASVGEIDLIDVGNGLWQWSYPTSDGPDDSVTVTITATDSDGAVDTETFTVTVLNLAPEVVLEPLDIEVVEGEIATNSVSFLDAGGEAINLSADIGTITDLDGDGIWEWSYATTDGPDESVTVTITASDGDDSESVSFDLTVLNVAPVVELQQGSLIVEEGGTATNQISVSDVGVDALTVEANIGNLTNLGNNNWGWSLPFLDGPAQETVTITVTDSDNAVTIVDFNVTVVNVAPTLIANNLPQETVTVDEGDLAIKTGTFSDPGNDTIQLSASVGTVIDEGLGIWSWSLQTTDDSVDNQTVTIFATDSDNFTETIDFQLVVNNVAPVITVDVPSETAAEGETAQITGMLSDIGNDLVTLTADVGIATNIGDGTWEWTYNPIDGLDESQTVTITADDGDGGQDTVTFQLVVTNTEPTIDLFGLSLTDSREPFNLILGPITDPGDDTVTQWRVNWGDGSTFEGNSFELFENITAGDAVAHEYSNNGSFWEITVDLVDEDGITAQAGRFLVANEDQEVILNLDALTVTGEQYQIDWGDESALAVSMDSRFTHVYPEPGDYEITITRLAADESILSSEIRRIAVNYVDPTPMILDVNTNATFETKGEEGVAIQLNGSFTDASISDTHTISVDWGDGNITNGIVDASTETFSANYSYVNGGIYTVTVTVTDAEGNTATQTTSAVVTGVGINDGVLQVIGTEDKDKVELKLKGNKITVETDFDSPKKQRFNLADINSVVIYVDGGDDDVEIDKNITLPVFVNGGDGKDKLKAGGGDTILLGGAGEDDLKGGDGNDILDGGGDKDKLNAGKGNDILLGGTGEDDLKGEDGRDILIGGTGKDDINGGKNDDIVIGDATNLTVDTPELLTLQAIWTGTGSYEERVAAVQAELSSDPNASFILSVSGDGSEDKLKGDKEDDLFYAEGSTGNLVDDVDSDSNEIVIPVAPAAPPVGEEGIRLVNGVLTITGTNGKDKVEVKRQGNKLEVETDFTSPKKQSFELDSVTSIEIFLEGGDDEAKIDKEIMIPTFISGGAGKDKLEAGSGDSVLLGGEGDDELKGGDGNDILEGGDGKDKLEGKEGNDILLGGDGDDEVKGEKGRDILIGGEGKDKLEGKEDEDIVVGGTTNLDGDRPSLWKWLTAWISPKSYQERVADVQADIDPDTNVELIVEVSGDGEEDELNGDNNKDLFYAELDEDVIKDQDNGNEVVLPEN